MIEIKDEHIKEAEELLIGGDSFDTIERIPFIKHLDACDLLAVPGSGKTTALLAKLFCLSKHLPLKNEEGILVLSHTNAAVNEIENKLKKIVPTLFEYPNFVGTIQTFVNKFLANPACFQKYGEYLSTVDDDVANKLIVNQTKSLGFDNPLSRYFFFQTYNQSAAVTKKLLCEEYNLTASKSKAVITKLKNIKVLNKGSLAYPKVKNNAAIHGLSVDNEIKQIVKSIATKAKKKTNKEKEKRGTLYTLDFLTKKFTYYQPLSFESNSGKALTELYENIFLNGIIRYRDSYSFGYWYLQEYPKIKTLLQKRFKYVFIDEMQDLEEFQIDIIDKIFHGDDSSTIIQRIGDINQSIYNSGKKVKITADWRVREPIKYLNDSNRLTKEIAEVVNIFTLDRQQDGKGNPRFIVNGKKELNSPIPPHIVLFDNDTKGQLKDTFSELIEKYELKSSIEGQQYGFNIIGWNAKWDDDEDHDGKLRLENIFNSYKKDSSSLKETYDSLSKYLQCFDKQKKTLEPARKAILNALIHTLRVEGITYSAIIRGKEKNRYYTKRELINHIQIGLNGSDYESFKNSLYKWSFDLAVKQNHHEVYISIKDFITTDFKDWFDFSITEKSNEFIGGNFEEIEPIEEDEPEDIKIKIGTVHSVKGQTHCATMYVETSYHKYETGKKRVIEALKKEEHDFNIENNDDKLGKQAFKMIYVGFSRPTHLLCFACLKENIEDEIENIKKAGWELVDLTIKE
jgi:superfamily I DNA/RNA helicase